MLPVPVSALMPSAVWLAPPRSKVALSSLTVNASGNSNTLSLITLTVMLAMVWPARMVTVPPPASLKSLPATAVPFTR